MYKGEAGEGDKVYRLMFGTGRFGNICEMGSMRVLDDRGSVRIGSELAVV